MKLIAEIGCNHKGSIEIAKKMIDIADCDIVKFQKRDNSLMSSKEYNAPHPYPCNSYGETYGKHREFLEFSLVQHKELKAHCEANGKEYMCSVWDIKSCRDIMSLNPKRIKIPSAMNLNKPLLEEVLKFDGEINVSLGMTNTIEIQKIANLLSKKEFVLYACTSNYPTSFEDLCLLEIEFLKLERICNNHKYFYKVGFSGHHLGIAADIAAMTLGAEYIERHFTLDRTW